ncbi:MAG: DNA topoisomerase IV subunit A [Erysipelotrichaceae bacterium]
MDEKIITNNLDDVFGERFGRYSKYIIQERALPDVRDGLKPVQRRIIYAMYKNGNTNDKGYRKSVKTVGDVIGNYHPHGDSSVYEAMVRLSQNWKMNEVLVDMQGNNGSIDDDPAAAMRYTEARLAKIAMDIIGDIDKETVNFILNFDDTTYEPTVLPSRILNVLVNGSTGIAAGYATNIPPHNLREVCDSLIYRLQYPNCSFEELRQFVKGPDFPTGGIVIGKDGIDDAFSSGKGKVLVRSKCEVLVTKQKQQIVITQIPYEVIKSDLVRKIDEIRVNKKVDGIVEVIDESDRNGLKIVVDLKKEANGELILNYLYKATPLQVNYNYNVVAIVDKKPQQLSLSNIIDAYLNFYEECVYRRSEYLLKKIEEGLHLIEGLIKAISVLDEVIALIRASKDKADSKNRIMLAFGFSNEQAEAIVTLRLYRLTSTDVVALQQEDEQLLKEKAYLQKIISDELTLKKVIAKEILVIKEKYGKERQSIIIDEEEKVVIDKADLISNDEYMISVSKDGYIKKSSLRSYNASIESITLKENDQLIGIVNSFNTSSLLVFTSLGNFGIIPIYDMQESKWKDIGEHINTYIHVAPNEKIVNFMIVKDYRNDINIISVSNKGMITQTTLDNYQLQRKSKLSISMKLKGEDKIVKVLINPKNNIMLLTSNGYATYYNKELIPIANLKAGGVKAMNLKSDDQIVDALSFNDESFLVVFTTNYQAKRIKISDIEEGNRYKIGTLIAKKVKTNPNIVCCGVIGNLNDEYRWKNENIDSLVIKDASLMALSATYSSNLNLGANSYRLENIEKENDQC